MGVLVSWHWAELMKNILEDNDFNLDGRTVVIVGTGPNANAAWHKVPHDAYIIVTNKAVLAKELPHKDLWLCHSPTLLKELWFREIMERFEGRKMPGEYDFMYEQQFILQAANPSLPRCFMWGSLTEVHPNIPYYFHEGPSLASTDARGDVIIPGFLRRGAGPAGCAAQLSYFKHAAEILFIGVDLLGKWYFDGTQNENKQCLKPDGSWPELPYFNKLIDALKSKGMNIKSLSKTMLRIEVVE